MQPSVPARPSPLSIARGAATYLGVGGNPAAARRVAQPAYVQNLRWDAIAWNTAADDLFRFGSKLPEERNVLELVFADSSMRRRMPALRRRRWALAQLRYDVAVAPDDPLIDLIETLRLLSPASTGVGSAPPGRRATRHQPSFDSSGTLHRYRHETLIVDEHRHLRMVVYFQT